MKLKQIFAGLAGGGVMMILTLLVFHPDFKAMILILLTSVFVSMATVVGVALSIE